jgi:hypothetical protein
VRSLYSTEKGLKVWAPVQYIEGSKSVRFLCSTEKGLKMWAPVQYIEGSVSVGSCAIQRRV